ncbi:ATP-binding protein [Actinomadura atramentaria]|uniref:ATP-binding protein n=1 Tax=Actinomadura atramentaria TaxID=1990 RepID=UPI00037E80EE|nr:ATP-binding protein [Actinomadura atramentaria]
MRADVVGGVVQARDIKGGVHLHAREPAAFPQPRQLPGTVALVDRDDVLAELDEAGESADVVVVSGPAGIGKTAVALHWANRRSGDFPDGQLYADLLGHAAVEPASPGDVLAEFIRSFGVPSARVPSGLAERAALYRSLTADRRLLVVLDDAHSVAQVVPLLPGPGGAAVVTSRWRLGGLMARGARAVQLGPLTREAATELLATRLGRDRVRADADSAERLAELCAYSPLALSVATARLAIRPNRTLGEMVSALGEEHRRLGVLSSAIRSGEDEMTVRAALELSYRNLPAEARRLYRLLGLYPGRTFDAHAAAALTGAPVGESADVLEQLTDANLIDDAPAGRYRFHELARLHARETAAEESDQVRAAALRRLVAWTLAATLAASGAAAPYRRLAEPPAEPGVPEPVPPASAADALRWFENELVNLRAIVRRAHDAGLHRHAWMIVDAAWPGVLHLGHGERTLSFDETGLAAARADGDRTAEAKMLNRTGLARRAAGSLDAAAGDFRAASVIWAELGNRSRTAGADRRLGWVEYDRGDLAAAHARFAAAAEAYRALGEPRHVALTLCDVATALIAGGSADGAVAALDEAAALLEDHDDAYNRARVLTLLAQARAAGGDPAAARDLAARACAAMRALGSAAGEAEALEVAGDLEARDGRTAAARNLYRRARAVLVAAGASTRTVDLRLAGLPDRD